MPLRLVVFDFDGTLSTSHIWNAFTGFGPSATPIPPPHSTTERGQIKRLSEIDATPQYGGPCGFSLQVFGGQERLQQLRELLEGLRNANIECMVCSRSLVGPLRKLLGQSQLLDFFSVVMGNIGAIGGPTAQHTTSK